MLKLHLGLWRNAPQWIDRTVLFSTIATSTISLMNSVGDVYGQTRNGVTLCAQTGRAPIKIYSFILRLCMSIIP